MPFQKKHKLGAKPINTEAFDRIPISFNVRNGVREKLKAIPDWKERLRLAIDKLIEEQSD
ncbi:MAG: hypothetical protein SAK29_18990 [Scytonema sp. PMC 1069.18]|nr:hypothetical protein [Scytonema sp. PMC 1069.18]MEC4883058.1 hypothetical protein [Scytonema sp. PMC 1070.18]MEC4883469.1 hypothetical protein [Scytonema sp. PMC 1070.18]